MLMYTFVKVGVGISDYILYFSSEFCFLFCYRACGCEKDSWKRLGASFIQDKDFLERKELTFRSKQVASTVKCQHVKCSLQITKCKSLKYSWYEQVLATYAGSVFFLMCNLSSYKRLL